VNQDARTNQLRKLLDLPDDLDLVAQRLAAFPWDSDEELVTLTTEQAKSVLRRYLDGAIAAKGLVAWAELLEGREDVGFETADLRQLLFELANPELEGPLSEVAAESWVERL
jgi:hypothetical protein